MKQIKTLVIILDKTLGKRYKSGFKRKIRSSLSIETFKPDPEQTEKPTRTIVMGKTSNKGD